MAPTAACADSRCCAGADARRRRQRSLGSPPGSQPCCHSAALRGAVLAAGSRPKSIEDQVCGLVGHGSVGIERPNISPAVDVLRGTGAVFGRCPGEATAIGSCTIHMLPENNCFDIWKVRTSTSFSEGINFTQEVTAGGERNTIILKLFNYKGRRFLIITQPEETWWQVDVPEGEHNITITGLTGSLNETNPLINPVVYEGCPPPRINYKAFRKLHRMEIFVTPLDEHMTSLADASVSVRILSTNKTNFSDCNAHSTDDIKMENGSIGSTILIDGIYSTAFCFMIWVNTSDGNYRRYTCEILENMTGLAARRRRVGRPLLPAPTASAPGPDRRCGWHGPQFGGRPIVSRGCNILNIFPDFVSLQVRKSALKLRYFTRGWLIAACGASPGDRGCFLRRFLICERPHLATSAPRPAPAEAGRGEAGRGGAGQGGVRVGAGATLASRASEATRPSPPRREGDGSTAAAADAAAGAGADARRRRQRSLAPARLSAPVPLRAALRGAVLAADSCFENWDVCWHNISFIENINFTQKFDEERKNTSLEIYGYKGCPPPRVSYSAYRQLHKFEILVSPSDEHNSNEDVSVHMASSNETDFSLDDCRNPELKFDKEAHGKIEVTWEKTNRRYRCHLQNNMTEAPFHPAYASVEPPTWWVVGLVLLVILLALSGLGPLAIRKAGAAAAAAAAAEQRRWRRREARRRGGGGAARLGGAPRTPAVDSLQAETCYKKN
ncbi:Protein of unknown function [Gryllus bimaculatus]|nr:Protein of unknown function [Gryllus bimaculatus]